jgi:hypothetical protein
MGFLAAPRSIQLRTFLETLTADLLGPSGKHMLCGMLTGTGQANRLFGGDQEDGVRSMWPLPFIFKQQIIQQPDKITFLYNRDDEVRRVRLDQPHQVPVTASGPMR